MRIYFDKENLISFVKSTIEKKDFDGISGLVLGCDVQYNFPKDELEDTDEDELVYWMSKIGDGSGATSFCPPKVVFPERDRKGRIKGDFYKNENSDVICSAYFLSSDCSRMCDEITKRNCIIIGKVGEEYEKLQSLNIHDSEVRSVTISSWSDYCPHLPLTDIIVADEHYFKHKDIYKKNDNELFRALLPNQNQASPVNVVIFTKYGEVSKEINLEDVCREIKVILEEHTKCKESTVTIIVTYNLHSRTAITNYYRIKHEACFHLKDNNLKKDNTTEIKSHLNAKNHEISNQILKEYQAIVDITKNNDKYTMCYSSDNKTKKSNLLNFN